MHILRSIGAILTGLLFIVISHNLVDKILEWAEIFPPPEEGLHETWMLLLATTYRSVLSVAGCYITAWLAAARPMLHAMVLGTIGLVIASIASAVVIPMNLSPAWYPIVLAILALPCAWLGGKIREIQIGAKQ